MPKSNGYLTGTDGFPHRDCIAHQWHLAKDHLHIDGHICMRNAETKRVTISDAHAVTEQECLACPNFKSRYIQYPITVEKLEITQPRYNDAVGHSKDIGKPVAVRPADSEKTYLGFLLGDVPWFTTARYDEKTRQMNVASAYNPGILVPSLGKIILGAESWWSMLKDPNELKDITDEAIESQFYVRLARELLGTRPKAVDKDEILAILMDSDLYGIRKSDHVTILYERDGIELGAIFEPNLILVDDTIDAGFIFNLFYKNEYVNVRGAYASDQLELAAAEIASVWNKCLQDALGPA